MAAAGAAGPHRQQRLHRHQQVHPGLLFLCVAVFMFGGLVYMSEAAKPAAAKTEFAIKLVKFDAAAKIKARAVAIACRLRPRSGLHHFFSLLLLCFAWLRPA